MRITALRVVSLLFLNAALGTEFVSAQGPIKSRVDPHGDPLPAGALARLGTVRLRHPGLQTLTFSPDGKHLASGGADSLVRLWDVATGRCLWVGHGHSNYVYGIDFTPDGNRLVSAGYDGSIHVWQVADGKSLRTIDNKRRSWLDSVKVLADGTAVATSDRYGHIRVWDLEKGTLKIEFQATVDNYNWFRVSFSPDGRLASGVGPGHAVQVWDVTKGRRVLELPAQKDYVYAAVLSPDQRYLASGGRTNDLQLWELASGQLLTTLPTQDAVFAFAPDGRSLASSGAYGIVRLWDLSSGKQTRSLLLQEGMASVLAFSRDGRSLATGTSGGTIRLWDPTNGKAATLPAGFDGPTTPLAFLPDGRTLAIHTARNLHLWEVTAPPKPAQAWTVREKRRLADVEAPISIAPDGKSLTAAQNHRLFLWDLESGAERLQLFDRSDRLAMAFSPDGKRLAIAVYDGLIVRDAHTGKTERHLSEPKTLISAVAFAPDGTTILAANVSQSREKPERFLTFWNADTGAKIRSVNWPIEQSEREYAYPAGSGYGPRLLFAPSGLTLAIHHSYQLEFWDVGSGQRVHRMPVRGLYAPFAFSPDGRLLAVAAPKHAIQLWELGTGQMIDEWTAHESDISGLVFSPDGQLLISGSNDTTVLVWDVTLGLRLVRSPPLGKIHAKRVAQCWPDLASTETKHARQAMADLVTDPAAAVALLDKHLRPIPKAAVKDIQQWIADLGDAAFPVREKAFQKLKELRSAADPLVRQALTGDAPLETRLRLEKLSKLLVHREVLIDNVETLRYARCIQLLETLATPEARHVLERLASGAPTADETRAAQAALGRLRRSGEQ